MRIHTISAVILLLAATALPVFAGSVGVVPEISPATISGGLALLAGGSLFLLSRLRRK